VWLLFVIVLIVAAIAVHLSLVRNTMYHFRALPGRGALVPALVLLSVLTAGCGDDSGVGKTLPVAGKVTLDDKPVTATSTIVLFKPDSAKGNTSTFEPTATVDSGGNYTLSTRGKRGAPPGWYKVTVTATELRSDAATDPHRHSRPSPRSLLPAKYGQAATTPLSIEVVESAASGAYDLKLTSK
jgi:hypothetical protein